MKRYYLITVAVCLLALVGMVLVFSTDGTPVRGVLKVGFIFENDESTPATFNFALARDALEKAYPGRVELHSRNDVLVSETEEPLRALVKKGCGIVFAYTLSDQVREVAADYPEVQFCQISHAGAPEGPGPDNYHTFNARIYQGQYVSGIAAGAKLREMIDAGTIAPGEAVVGFVGTFPGCEAVSGYTAFLLGMRSVAPEAVMRVRYTGAASSFPREKAAAAALIEEGCMVIAQNSPTIGPAVACEEVADGRLFHVGYSQSMVDVAPTTSLISARANWTPYVTQAVGAILDGWRIESVVNGAVNGRDMNAGFERGWVEMLELNAHIAAEGTEALIQKATDDFRRGRLEVFRGDYVGVDPDDPEDTIDLSEGYQENRDSSVPSFKYVLKDVITVEE